MSPKNKCRNRRKRVNKRKSNKTWKSCTTLSSSCSSGSSCCCWASARWVKEEATATNRLGPNAIALRLVRRFFCDFGVLEEDEVMLCLWIGGKWFWMWRREKEPNTITAILLFTSFLHGCPVQLITVFGFFFFFFLKDKSRLPTWPKTKNFCNFFWLNITYKKKKYLSNKIL